MIHEGQLEVFDLTLTAKAPVFIGSGKSYVKKECLFNATFCQSILRRSDAVR